MTAMDKIQHLLEDYEFSQAQVNEVRLRLGDWFMSGGRPEDNYVWQQARYLENLVRYGLVERKVIRA